MTLDDFRVVWRNDDESAGSERRVVSIGSEDFFSQKDVAPKSVPRLPVRCIHYIYYITISIIMIFWKNAPIPSLANSAKNLSDIPAEEIAV
jgi:hypothetical protein